jgi:hypothetical protein
MSFRRENVTQQGLSATERLPRCPVCYRKPARKPRLLRAVFYLHFTNEGGKPKERPQAAFASGATISTGSSNQAGHRLYGKVTPPGVLLPSRTYPHMGRHDPVRLVDLAGSAHQWEQSHSGESLLFLPYYSLAGATALARRCRIVPTVLPGLLD